MLRIGIVIVTHNSADHIEACLGAIARMHSGSNTFVIDNASRDRTAEIVERMAQGNPGIRLVQNVSNAGFGAAANLGFELLKEQVDAVLLLNPDVMLTTPLQALAEACQRSGVAGGCLMDPSGAPQVGFSFRRFPSAATLFFETIGLNRVWKSNPVNSQYRCLDADFQYPQKVEQPAGAMLMIRKDVWIATAGFDEQFYPVWFEDVDLCKRAAVSGFHAEYVPAVRGIHHGGHSVLQLPIHERKQYWYGSLIRYSRKHFGRFGQVMVAGGVAAVAVARGLGAVLRWRDGSFKEAAMNLMIARNAIILPKTGPVQQGSNEVGSASTADVRSRVSNEGIPSTNENTERTLKRLHAR